MKSSSFARLARAFFIFVHFGAVLVLFTSWNNLYYRCVDGVDDVDYKLSLQVRSPTDGELLGLEQGMMP